uniref:Integrase zinc-binding domain-containing protein n=1 Tax=Romanomermis culicivorax TaxID=13658 RepID=A0A915K837_ROMCU
MLRRQLMNKAHEGHPGIVRAKIKLREMYWWPGIPPTLKRRSTIVKVVKILQSQAHNRGFQPIYCRY